MSQLSLIQSNFALTTWLALGASLQSVLFLLLPRHVALLPAFVLLLSRLITGALITKGYTKNPYLPEDYMHKMTAPIPNEDGSELAKAGDKSLVVFIVGASINQ